MAAQPDAPPRRRMSLTERIPLDVWETNMLQLLGPQAAAGMRRVSRGVYAQTPACGFPEPRFAVTYSFRNHLHNSRVLGVVTFSGIPSFLDQVRSGALRGVVPQLLEPAGNKDHRLTFQWLPPVDNQLVDTAHTGSEYTLWLTPSVDGTSAKVNYLMGGEVRTERVQRRLCHTVQWNQ